MKVNRKLLELAMARACMNTVDLVAASGLPGTTVQNAIVGKGVRPGRLPSWHPCSRGWEHGWGSVRPDSDRYPVFLVRWLIDFCLLHIPYQAWQKALL